MTTQLQGVEELKRVFKLLPERCRKNVLRAGVRAGAVVVQKAVLARAPVNPDKATRQKYGHLRDNIKIKMVRGNTADIVRYVVTTGRAFWGNFLEFGTRWIRARPFMRPALDESAGPALQAMVKVISVTIEKEAAILAGPAAKARKRFL